MPMGALLLIVALFVLIALGQGELDAKWKPFAKELGLDCPLQKTTDSMPLQRCVKNGVGVHRYEINAEGSCPASFDLSEARALGIHFHGPSKASRDTGNFFTTGNVSNATLSKLKVKLEGHIPNTDPRTWTRDEVPCAKTSFTKIKIRFGLTCTSEYCYACQDCSAGTCLYAKYNHTAGKFCHETKVAPRSQTCNHGDHADGSEVVYECTIKKWVRLWGTSWAWEETHPATQGSNGNAKYNARPKTMQGLNTKTVKCKPLRFISKPNGYHQGRQIAKSDANVCGTELQLALSRI